MKFFDIIFIASLLICAISGTKLRKSNLQNSQSQINDPAKFKYIKDCTNKVLNPDGNFCCTLRVNDALSIDKTVCVNLKQKNNLEPMATIASYLDGRCKYSSYATVDGIERVYCKSGSEQAKMWQVQKFVRVLNPSNAERSLETCDVNSNFSRCW